MIKLLAAVVLAAYWGGVPPIYKAINVNTAKRVLHTSVLLRMKTVKDGKGKRHYGGCSGTYVDSRHILTAAHCFEHESVEFVYARGPNDGVGYPVHVVKLSHDVDLALLEVPYAHQYAKLAKGVSIGETVTNVGSPFNFEFVLSQGIVGALAYKAEGYKAKYIITTAMANPGSSGGGAFNEAGELVGVNTMITGMFGWTGITMTVSTDDVRAFLGK